jgi:hypothetical protein
MLIEINKEGIEMGEKEQINVVVSEIEKKQMVFGYHLLLEELHLT